MRGSPIILMVLLVASGCGRQPPLPADIAPLPENPGAEIRFLQTRDQVTSIRVRRDGEHWIDVPADQADALFAALHPVGVVSEGSAVPSKCDLHGTIRLQGEEQSLTVVVHSHRESDYFAADGHYETADRRVPLHFAGSDATRLSKLLQDIEMAAQLRK